MPRLTVLLLMLLVMPAQADVYKWVDASGKVHYSDKKPAHDAEPVDVRLQNTFERVEVTRQLLDALRTPGPVTMYSTSWCGYCAKARAYFRANGIAYTEYDIEDDRTAHRRYLALGGRGVPLLVVGEKQMQGFSPERFKRFYE